MLGLFQKKKKKNIDTDSLVDFNKILKTIERFIDVEDFEKASLAIQEILWKEDESFKIYIEKIPEKQKNIEIKNFKNKIGKIKKLEKKNKEKQKKHNEKHYLLKRKHDLSYVGKKTQELLSQKNFLQAGDILEQISQKYSGDIFVMNHIGKIKRKIFLAVEKNKKKREKEIKKDTYAEAKELIGEIVDETQRKKVEKTNSLFKRLFSYGIYVKNTKITKREKKLLLEVEALLESQETQKEIEAKSKLALIHTGLQKEIQSQNINGFEIYGKIIGADKISGDSIGFYQDKKRSIFYIGDATGHGIRAGFIVSQLNKKFQEIIQKFKSLENLAIETNNSLKQNLKSGNFITSVFFEISQQNPDNIDYIGMGHEPMFVFRKKTREIEKVIPGGLAAGIRIIKDESSIKKKSIFLEDGDILLVYTDGIAEAKNPNNEMYSIERVGEKLRDFARNPKLSIEDIYKKIIDDLTTFVHSTNYNDDVTLLLIKRDASKELLNKREIDNILEKSGVEEKYKKRFRGKTKEETYLIIEKIHKEKSLKSILLHLGALYKTGEVPVLKTECVRVIKEGFIHPKINFYLKKAIESENNFKLKQKNKKVYDKYQVLLELYKKGDYNAVIRECSDIIEKEGNI